MIVIVRGDCDLRCLKKMLMTKEEDVDDEEIIHRFVRIIYFLFVTIEGVNTCVFR